MTDKTQTIRSLNDRFRLGDTAIPGQILITSGLTDLLEETLKPVADLAHEVRRFEDFSEANDPHGEHDFGAFDFAGETCFWKIDYYDTTLQAGSENPADPTKTVRVLTIMLASEY